MTLGPFAPAPTGNRLETQPEGFRRGLRLTS